MFEPGRHLCSSFANLSGVSSRLEADAEGFSMFPLRVPRKLPNDSPRDAIHFGLSRICRNCIGVTGSAVEAVVETVVNSVETVDYVL